MEYTLDYVLGIYETPKLHNEQHCEKVNLFKTLFDLNKIPHGVQPDDVFSRVFAKISSQIVYLLLPRAWRYLLKIPGPY